MIYIGWFINYIASILKALLLKLDIENQFWANVYKMVSNERFQAQYEVKYLFGNDLQWNLFDIDRNSL